MGDLVVKRVLMIAYHFPPLNVSSGIQRTACFAQYLPRFGWAPAVLTVHPHAYADKAQDGNADVLGDVRVHRTFALDAARHLSFAGRYARLLALPDRWWSWWFSAVPAGLRLIREMQPDVLWSTYPIATAHLIGYTLHRLTGIPWVADFRDPMAQDGYPEHPLEHRAFEWVEHCALKHCRRALFTAPGAMKLYADRYPDVPRSRLGLIENGYDEAAFASASCPSPRRRGDGPFVLRHSGTVYPSERDPRPLLAALAALKAAGTVTSARLRLVLRATGCDDYLRPLIHSHGIEDLVTLQPALPYRDALSEMLGADALLVLQAANCNYQVPAKLYEYLRARRPVIALTDPGGDTAAILRNAGIDTIAPLDAKDAIAQTLTRFLDLLATNCAPLPDDRHVQCASRVMRTQELSRVLDDVSA